MIKVTVFDNACGVFLRDLKDWQPVFAIGDRCVCRVIRGWVHRTSPSDIHPEALKVTMREIVQA